jgi:hypothetical protein
MSTPSKFPSKTAAKAAGWFSRRHQTSEAHQKEQERRRKELEVRKVREESYRAN